MCLPASASTSLAELLGFLPWELLPELMLLCEPFLPWAGFVLLLELELSTGFLLGGGPMEVTTWTDVASGRNCPNSASKSSWFWNRLETCKRTETIHQYKMYTCTCRCTFTCTLGLESTVGHNTTAGIVCESQTKMQLHSHSWFQDFQYATWKRSGA